MKIKQSIGSRIATFVIYLFMILLCITTVYPFWQTLILSISSRAEAMGTGFHLWTTQPDFSAWLKIFESPVIVRACINTVIRTVGGTAFGMFISVTMAYPLAKKKFPNRKFYTALVIFTMMFNGGMIPTYILVKNLHLMDTLWALILPSAVSPFNLIIIKNFFTSIPESLEETAKIDGANDIYILWKVVLPLSMPVLATVTLWLMVGQWNSWFDAVMYTSDRSNMVLQLFLREIVITQTAMSDPTMMTNQANVVQPATESIQSAAMMFVTIPILIVYPFLQKYFAKGVMVGAIKG